MEADIYAVNDGTIEIDIKNKALFGIVRTIVAKLFISNINAFSFMKAYKALNGNIRFTIPQFWFNFVILGQDGTITIDVVVK